MIPDRVAVAFGKAIDTGNFEAMMQAIPDARLMHPVGNIDFPGRQFAGGCFHALAPALAASGVYGD